MKYFKMRLLWLWAILAMMSACGTTMAQKFNMANEAAHGMRKIIGPQINKVCKSKAVACGEAKVEKEKCTELAKCRTVRDAFYLAVEGVHVAVILYKAGKAAGKPEATLQGILTSARRALDEAFALAIKAGYVKPTGGGSWSGPAAK